MILGYIISGEDNDSYMFYREDPNLPICRKCGYVTDFEYVSPMFKLIIEAYDISSTYDNRVIVSGRFKDFCTRNNYEGVEFRELPNNRNFYTFMVQNVIPFDTGRAKLRLDTYCDECGNYESVTPALPLVIKGLTEPLCKDGFFATDIHFASGNEKSPVIIIGTATYEKVKKERFTGMHLLKFDTELSILWKRR